MVQKVLLSRQSIYGAKFMAKVLVAVSLLATISCSTKSATDSQLKLDIAQKLMLDIRYFCHEKQAAQRCTEPVTQLPEALSQMIAESGIGGIVLFADNLQSTEQILTLNHDLQKAAMASQHPALFIAIDQEGGRVVRLPEGLGTSFSGNMAIGATSDKHGDHYAKLSGAIIGKELMSLGFNVNFAPTVDVNINPDNPVINVRSYGESPVKVAELGLAQMNAMQQQGIISTLKHFPGHGDTNVDSHTGLPRVSHSKQQIDAVDLLPFQYAIDNSSPGMIMTAHIQYPELDKSQFTDKSGEKTVLPATMSSRILTDILRTEMGYQGVIITDALDMAGIAMFYDHTEAVIQTFKAGADIALMPLEIRSPQDIDKLYLLITNLAKAVNKGELNINSIRQSSQRISALKQQFSINTNVITNLALANNTADAVLNSYESDIAEQQLADAAITEIKNNGVVPIDSSIKKIHLVMPDTTKCMTMTYALKARRLQLDVTCESTANLNSLVAKPSIEADLYIAADISPQQSLVELGGMDDIASWRQRPDKATQIDYLLNLATRVKTEQKPFIFINLRTPYVSNRFAPLSDAIFATYAYNTYKIQYTDELGRIVSQFEGPSFHALADVLLGVKVASGSLPVSVPLE